MEKKQTAVDWFVESINYLISKEIGIQEKFKNLTKEANKIGKEHIIDAVNSQRQLGWDEKGEQYYNENFKN